MPQSPERKIIVNKEPVSPSLFTLQRARRRAEIYNFQGETHRLDDIYSPAPKYHPPEPVRYKGKADHTAPFSCYYKQVKSLESPFLISIVSGRGGDQVSEDMFKPKINVIKKKKRDSDDEESDTSDTPAQKAYKKQQAHVEKLYWHEGDGGRAATRECYCVYGETRHYKREKRRRPMSARQSKRSKEIWTRLLRPKSAAVIRKRD